MPNRLSRLRRNENVRRIMREVSVSPDDLIYPIFVREGIQEREPIDSMPGQWRYPVTELPELAKSLQSVGVASTLVFGLPKVKDERAKTSAEPNGVVSEAIRAIKDSVPNLVVMTDVCVCAYMAHGHCGVIREGKIDNNATLPLLADMAVAHANAGADLVGPSSMMDEQVGAIRHALNETGHFETGILAYSAKFSSSFYGPFREAADSAPSFGDRASYQHDFANARHAIREIKQDEIEGADILMVKPGLAYLDILYRAREISNLPLAVYAVSGEYSMIKAAAERGWLDEKKIVTETLTAFRRAGADLIITYHAPEAAKWLNEY